jgi:hypothetical protein
MNETQDTVCPVCYDERCNGATCRPVIVRKTWLVRLYRDTRWDVYPQRPAIEEVLVTCSQNARDRWLADEIIQQHPRWSGGGFILESVTEVP